MSLTNLRNLGVDALLRDAALTISVVGLARGVTADAKTGALDVEGAIYLAAGAPFNYLVVCDGDLKAAGVPEAKMFAVTQALEAIEAKIDQPVIPWADYASTDEVIRTLCDVADLISIA